MYAHLLGQRAAVQAVQEDRLDVTIGDVEAAIQRSIKSHMLRSDYLTATQSSRPGNLYSRVLVACAMADKNALGQFRAGAVRAPMSQIMGSTYNIPAFARHLTEFTEPSRGSVLIREGRQRGYTYRFRDPLLQPYALMTAMSDGTLSEEFSRSIFRPLDDRETLD
jgi:hypothetical protein